MLDEQDLTLAQITLPSGASREQTLVPVEAGLLRASFESDELGLFRIENGDKTTFALIGSLDAPELAQVISTPAKIEPVARASGGNVMRGVERSDGAFSLPAFQIINQGERALSNRLVLQTSRDSRLLRLSSVPLYTAFWALFITLLLLGMTWRRESR